MSSLMSDSVFLDFCCGFDKEGGTTYRALMVLRLEACSGGSFIQEGTC